MHRGSRYPLIALNGVLILAILAPARSVFADDRYPPLVRSELGLRSEPACTLCHTTAVGRKRTATKKFAETLQILGLPPAYDPGKLSAILDEMDACSIDSDDDGVSDTEEIRNGDDPSDGSGGATTQCGGNAGGAGGASGRVELGGGVDIFDGRLPEHGCALGSSRTRAGAGGVLLALMALGLVRRTARGRTRRSSGSA
jgi:hypothetical protein